MSVEQPLQRVCALAYHHSSTGSIIAAMNAAAKLLEGMRRSPLDWSLADLQVVAKQQNIMWRHKGGSHGVFVRSDGRSLPIPARRPIKPVYIRMFLALVDGE